MTRRYLALALFIIAIITAIIWAVSAFIQPIFPAETNGNVLIIAAIFTAVVAILAGIKDIVELIRSFATQSNEITDHRYEQVHKSMTKGLEDDLHELINWYHSGVVLYLDELNYLLANGKYAQAKRRMPEILDRAYSTVDELRIMQISINSRIYEQENFSDALHTLVSEWAARAGSLSRGKLPIRLECPNNLRLPIQITEPVLRIATGALTNAIFHSGILKDPNIEIRIIADKADEHFTLRFIDDGLGSDQIKDGYGISRMKNLVQQLNNTGWVTYLDIASKKNKGTTVTLRLALKRNEN